MNHGMIWNEGAQKTGKKRRNIKKNCKIQYIIQRK